MFTIQVNGDLTSLQVELQIGISKELSVWNAAFEVKLTVVFSQVSRGCYTVCKHGSLQQWFDVTLMFISSV